MDMSTLCVIRLLPANSTRRVGGSLNSNLIHTPLTRLSYDFTLETMRHLLLTLGILMLCSCASTSDRAASTQDRARMYVDAANGALTEGDATAALHFLVEAEKLDSKIPELHHSRALAYSVKEMTTEAIRSAQRAVELEPDYSAALTTYGRLLMDAGRLKDAEKMLRKAANNPLNSESFKAKTSLGILYVRLSDLERAEKEFNSAISSAPRLACVTYYYRGDLHSKKGNFKRAIADYNKATEHLCGRFADAHLALGIAYIRDRRFEDARRKLLEVRKLFPDSKAAETAMTQLRYLP